MKMTLLLDNMVLTSRLSKVNSLMKYITFVTLQFFEERSVVRAKCSQGPGARPARLES